MIGALGLVGASAVLALAGTLATFAISFFILVLGVSNLTVAGQAWISHRVDYRRRARSIGLYETSWAIALLAGAPIVAVLINVFGWRGPFVAIAIACVARCAPRGRDAARPRGSTTARPDRARRTRTTPSGTSGDSSSITARAWLVMIGSATTAMAGLVGVRDLRKLARRRVRRVDRRHRRGRDAVRRHRTGVQPRQRRVRRPARQAAHHARGLAALLVGLAVMVGADDRLWIGIVGLVVFLLGFELAFVVSLSLVSEAMPDARGVHPGGRATRWAPSPGPAAQSPSGWLYGIHGIGGTAGAVGRCWRSSPCARCSSVGGCRRLVAERRRGTAPSLRPRRRHACAVRHVRHRAPSPSGSRRSCRRGPPSPRGGGGGHARRAARAPARRSARRSTARLGAGRRVPRPSPRPRHAVRPASTPAAAPRPRRRPGGA